jgi:hypothetical protein
LKNLKKVGKKMEDEILADFFIRKHRFLKISCDELLECVAEDFCPTSIFGCKDYRGIDPIDCYNCIYFDKLEKEGICKIHPRFHSEWKQFREKILR